MIKIQTLSLNLYQIFLYYRTILFRIFFSKFMFLQFVLLKMNYNIDIIFPYYFFLPKQKKRFTVLRSPHVHKKSREQFELVTYSSFFIIQNYLNTVHRFSFLSLKSFFKNHHIWFRSLINVMRSSNNYLFLSERTLQC